MSSLAIRGWFREEIVARVPSLPFIETVNKDAPNAGKNLPALWCTLEFSNATEQRQSLGRRALFREFGEAQIIVLGKSGLGDLAVITAAELVRSQFFGIRSEPVPWGSGSDIGYLTLDSADPPNTDATENGNWFLASVSCSYTFDTYRGTP